MAFQTQTTGEGLLMLQGNLYLLERKPASTPEERSRAHSFGFCCWSCCCCLVWLFGLVLIAHGVGQLSSGKLSRPKDNSMQAGLSPGLHTEDTDPHPLQDAHCEPLTLARGRPEGPLGPVDSCLWSLLSSRGHRPTAVPTAAHAGGSTGENEECQGLNSRELRWAPRAGSYPEFPGQARAQGSQGGVPGWAPAQGFRQGGLVHRAPRVGSQDGLVCRAPKAGWFPGLLGQARVLLTYSSTAGASTSRPSHHSTKAIRSDKDNVFVLILTEALSELHCRQLHCLMCVYSHHAVSK